MTRRLPVLLWIVAVVCIVPAAIINALLDYSTTIDLVANAGFTLLVVGAATTGALAADARRRATPSAGSCSRSATGHRASRCLRRRCARRA